MLQLDRVWERFYFAEGAALVEDEAAEARVHVRRRAVEALQDRGTPALPSALFF